MLEAFSSNSHSPIEFENMTSSPEHAQKSTVLQGTVQKIQIFIASTFINLKKAILTLHYYLCFFEPSIYERHAIFEGKTHSPYAGNHGRKEDIPLFLEKPSIPVFEENAKRFGLSSEQAPTLSPFGQGICFGAATHFNKRWLETGDIQEVSQEFQGGAPYESVLLQACYVSYQEGCEYYCQTIYGLLKELHSAAQNLPTERTLKEYFSETIDNILKKNESSDTPLNRLILLGTVLYLFPEHDEENVEMPSYCTFMKALFKKHASISLTGTLYSTLRLFGQSLGQSDRQRDWDVKRAASLSIGVDLTEQVHHNVSAKTVLDSISDWKPGAYDVNVPVYSPFGTLVGYHALSFIKVDEEHASLYDPNIASGTIESSPKALLKRAYEVYCGSIDVDTHTARTKIIAGLQRIRNFFLMQANPPLFGDLPDCFEVYRVELAT